MSAVMSCRSLHAAGQQYPTAENRASVPFDNPLLVPTAAMAYRFNILVSRLHQLAVLTRLVLFVTVPNVSLLPGTHTTHPLDNMQCRQA